MAFSNAFLEEVKEKNDIIEVVGRQVPLKRAGSNYVGLCPFHSEKTPSFTVFPATQSYYCFGCGAGGDAVTFVMQTEGLDYPAAIEALANRAGIPVEEDGARTGERSVKKQRVIGATREAGRFFYAKLMSAEGAAAREYLKRREISDLTIKRFGIGYAPDTGFELTRYLRDKGFTEEELKASFLSGVSKKGNLYDIFRNRIMFPVFDLAGSPVAFSARRLNEADERKYVNTSDTPAFKKSRILFGLNIAKSTSDGTLILCEGAVDAIALHQAGFDNACATLGTAITPEHARIIARFAKTAYLAYDIDKAGRAATDKAMHYLNEVGVATKIINLGTEAKDPDEYIKKYGADSFRRRLKGSEGQNEYTLNTIIGKYNMDIPDEKAFAAREVTSFLASLSSGAERDIYTSYAAGKLGINPAMLADDVRRAAAYLRKKNKNDYDENMKRDAEGFGDKVNRDRVRFSSAATLEERILGIMITHPDLAPDAAGKLTENSFVTEFGRRVFAAFEESFRKGSAPQISTHGFTPAETARISRMMAQRETAHENSASVLDELITKLGRQKEMTEADEKIKEDPASSLADYIEKLRDKK
ncbi:MAG: DNA primase [Clostridia bacterium]|nr:DNA primase [Clostridia bacterium]